MNNKIIIIGSSVSMPRNEVSYEDTWVSKFISTYNNFIDELHPNIKGHEKLFKIINSNFSKINE